MLFSTETAIVIDATLYLLLLFSLLTWVLILFKIWQFSHNHQANRQFNGEFWQASDFKSARQLIAHSARSPKARIANCGFIWLDERNQSPTSSLRFRGPSQALLEHVLRQATRQEQSKIESGLSMLASIGSTAPFVGLFGTVVGIMRALHDIGVNGSASLDVVAGPIGEALIATAIGIAVAVPAVLAYNFFIRSAKQHRAALEQFVDGFMHIAMGDALYKGRK
ncbi:MotA/TolQ/ExbB proton channel family protein [Methylomonas sp. MgM2]